MRNMLKSSLDFLGPLKIERGKAMIDYLIWSFMRLRLPVPQSLIQLRLRMLGSIPTGASNWPKK